MLLTLGAQAKPNEAFAIRKVPRRKGNQNSFGDKVPICSAEEWSDVELTASSVLTNMACTFKDGRVESLTMADTA